MQHIEQHILELFVLDAEEVRSRRTEIEAHLAECHGCRSLVEQMEGSYREAEARFRELQDRPAAVGEAMERVRQKPAPRYESGSAPAKNYRPVTRFQRVQYLVRRHPVIVGSGTFAAFAFLAFLLWMPNRSVTKDLNPVYVHPDVGAGMLGVYNRDLQKVWDLPASGLPEIVKTESANGLKFSVLADLDGDGKNELITTVPVAGIGTTSTPVLSVFSPAQERKFTKPYLERVAFRGREYTDPFGAHFLEVGDFSGSGSNEIIVKIDNVRSTNAVLRVSGNGTVLGEYWHYGAIHALYSEDVNQDGKPEVILCGQNDVNETAGERFAFLTVIDPARMIGKTESSCTPGFGFSKSSAELLYMRFPATDMNAALAASGFIARVVTSGAGDSVARSVWYAGATDSTDALLIQYFLSKEFGCVEVRSTDRTGRLHDILAQQKKVSGKIDGAYLENLRKGVRYFDGKEWRKEVVWMNPPS